MSAHRSVFWLLALTIVLAHVVIVDHLGAWLAAGFRATAEPVRLQAAFLRPMQVADAPAPMPAAPPPARRLRAAAPPVGTAEAKAAEPAASAPEPAASASAEPIQEAVANASPASAPLSDPAASASIAAAADSSASQPAAAPPFEWPVGTRLRYALTGYVRGEVLGHAQVEWLREGSRYQVHLDVVVGASFAPLMQRRMTSDGDITPQGLAPRRYDERTQIAFAAARESTVLFEPGGLDGRGTVTLADGRRQSALPGVQDTASQLVQLSYLFASGAQRLQAGARVELPVALPRRMDRWAYDVAGEEWLETPVGRISTWHLVPLRAGDAATLSMEAWFAPGLRYLPVRIVIRSGKDDHIDLLIDSLPLQAEPEPEPSGGSLAR